MAAREDLFAVEKNPVEILHRWGQLKDGIFSEPQIFVSKHCVNSEWVANFIRHFDVGYNGAILLGLLSDVGRFRESLIRMLPDDRQARNILPFLDRVLAHQNEVPAVAETT